MTLYQLGDVAPILEDDQSIFVAPGAHIIGKVRVAKNCSIWFGTVIRGDNEEIRLGAGTNVQENSILHTDPGFPLTIGENCTIGHGAILHGCQIGNNSLIGMGATVLNGAKIGAHCLIGAGALVTEGKEIPDNSMVLGSPARVVRELDENARKMLEGSGLHYQENAARFRAHLKPIK
ncbi:MAG: gamma carbonic anhydrase family protein [Pseudomonadota bacterium]